MKRKRETPKDAPNKEESGNGEKLHGTERCEKQGKRREVKQKISKRSRVPFSQTLIQSRFLTNNSQPFSSSHSCETNS